ATSTILTSEGFVRPYWTVFRTNRSRNFACGTIAMRSTDSISHVRTAGNRNRPPPMCLEYTNQIWHRLLNRVSAGLGHDLVVGGDNRDGHFDVGGIRCRFGCRDRYLGGREIDLRGNPASSRATARWSAALTAALRAWPGRGLLSLGTRRLPDEYGRSQQ